MDTMQKPFIQFYYRTCILRLTPEQRVYLERYFGLVRMIYNRFVTTTQAFKDIEIKSMHLTYEQCRSVVDAMLIDGNNDLLTHLPPSLIESTIHVFVDDWKAFQGNRGKRPTFKSSRDSQSLWVIDKEDIQLDEDTLTLPGDEGMTLTLVPSRISLPPHVTTYHIQRTDEEEYTFTGLYERAVVMPHHHQDAMITLLGKQIRDIEQKSLIRRRRMWQRAGQHRSLALVNIERHACPIRKKVLDRLLRLRSMRLAA